MTQHLPAVEFMLEALKLLRNEWLSQADLAKHFGVRQASVSREMRRLCEHGYVESEKRTSEATGRYTTFYRLASSWVGQA